MKTFTDFSISTILGEISEIETETKLETAFGEISFKQFSANYFFSYQQKSSYNIEEGLLNYMK